jgi:hypothetical protein
MLRIEPQFKFRPLKMNFLTINPALGTSANTGGPKPNSTLPVTFRLPRSGERDPYFGLSRSWFYSAEENGRIKLIRLREKGKTRGTTLVPTEDVLGLIYYAKNSETN